jgi:predicted RNA-binding Zn-ribbon protein involved in translation (DUF1610 family)
MDCNKGILAYYLTWKFPWDVKRNQNQEIMMAKKAKIECPHCGKTIILIKSVKGRVIVTTVSGAVLATAGGFLGAGIGATIGVATGGTATPATIPLGIAGGVFAAVVGLGVGYVIGNKIDKPHCPSCGGKFDLPKR